MWSVNRHLDWKTVWNGAQSLVTVLYVTWCWLWAATSAQLHDAQIQDPPPCWSSSVLSEAAVAVILEPSPITGHRSMFKHTVHYSPKLATYCRPFLIYYLHFLRFQSSWRINSSSPSDKVLSGLPPYRSRITYDFMPHTQKMFQLSLNLEMKLSTSQKLSQVFTEAEGRMRKYHPQSTMSLLIIDTLLISQQKSGWWH